MVFNPEASQVAAQEVNICVQSRKYSGFVGVRGAKLNVKNVLTSRL